MVEFLRFYYYAGLIFLNLFHNTNFWNTISNIAYIKPIEKFGKNVSNNEKF